ncbi:MAG TPA: DUF4286 family protein [Saprospiraceae bacterium]|nr:DUF4286 family protein [Saprospiraceae bacterium]
MFLFNETIGIDKAVEEEWLRWMKEEHIVAVMNTGMFISSKIYKVMHEHDDETTSYSIQYFSNSIDNVQKYLEDYAPGLIEQFQRKYKDRHVAFRTLLLEI